MRLLRIGQPGGERPVVEVDGVHYDAGGVVEDFGLGFWAEGPAALAEAVASGALPRVDVEGQRVGAALPRGGALICIGMNYAAHAAESGSAPPERPIVFLKSPATLAGPDDEVTIPRGSTKTDWEVELGVVIGQEATNLGEDDDPLAHVAGYVLANDLSERTFQLEESGGQWSKGKCCRGFLPLGPYVATPDEVDATSLRLRSWVNGEPRQDSSTADLVFSVAELVRDLSQYMTLEPGDLVLTGTPEGVALSGRFPYLAPGDVVELEIDGLGRQRQTYRGA
ncbi:fumarylacetoacetate hydrolase family protein [Auraticoccus monumenti]|uniref:2-keto-4-pentenoate hydratase/2-oxohepta-3-ene-1,7-dioic acid hydratase (Catechol pathway) n=1 Tax=Auraticoccus monumenti TaxID=675864 RepID=A0A1G7AAF0_9ACTN|nr:fumarylacetoacetate hydrolase family protein [Auraticoccus monumenti]SDE11673.1 2-keto-4-pentenoate hydratase/2-oxohepta-3-ene-1,7-dioic acid hydratase (catechol pathway) [Auraticoccus monumenti]